MSQPPAPPQAAPAAGTAAPAPVALTYRFVADADAASRVARALARGSVRSRRMRIVYGLLALVAVVSYALDPGFGVVMTVYAVLVFLGLPLVIRARATRVLRRTLAPGTEVWSGFGPTAFATRGPLGASEYAYGALRSVRRVDGAVLVRMRDSTMLWGFPQELFPDHELARLEALVAAQHGGRA